MGARRLRPRRDATTTACSCSRRGSAKAVTSSPTSSAPPPPARSDRAGARRGDVRAGGVRPDGDGGDRGEEVRPLIARAAAIGRRGIAALRGCAQRRIAAGVARHGRCSARRGCAGPAAGRAARRADAVRSTMVVDRHGDVAVRGALRPTARARCGCGPTRCRRCWSRRRWPPRIAASARTPASIRSRSRARRVAQRRRGRRRRRRLDITQQVAKLLLDRRAQLAAGTRGAWLGREDRRGGRGAAARAPAVSKREILALYLNLAPYGNQIAGAERASRAYFGSDRVDADAGAGGVPGRRCRSGRRASTRGAAGAGDARASASCCARMERRGCCRRPTAARRAAERLRLADARRALPRAALRRAWCWPTCRIARPTRIETTLDAALQRDVDGHHPQPAAVAASSTAPQRRRRRARQRDAASGWRGKARATTSTPSTAARSTAPVTPRQPGSALKPFTYALAFERGCSPATRAAPTCRRTFRPPKPAWSTARATTTAGIRGPLLARARAGRIRERAGRRAGVRARRADAAALPAARRLHTFDKTAAHYGLGLTLGNAEVRLDELVAAYAAFARGGEWIEPHVRARLDPQPPAGRSAQLVVAADRVLDHRHPVRRRGARVHLRPRRQPRVPVPGRGRRPARRRRTTTTGRSATRAT